MTQNKTNCCNIIKLIDHSEKGFFLFYSKQKNQSHHFLKINILCCTNTLNIQLCFFAMSTATTAPLDIRFFPVASLPHYNELMLYLQSAGRVIRCFVDKVLL